MADSSRSVISKSSLQRSRGRFDKTDELRFRSGKREKDNMTYV